MNKLLCERPRGGWRLKTHRASRHRRDWDSEPSHGRMPGKVRSSKWLNENLQPLRRFLLSKVGRPWDRVYSELRANLRVRKAIDLHILQHLDRMVALEVRYEAQVPMVLDRDGWRAIRGTRWDELFVCPRTGLLRRYQPKRRR
ncbi:hypothetical protein [Enhygromyxa salina]|nr:hypothetical protein [Enhygromyxa salina]